MRRVRIGLPVFLIVISIIFFISAITLPNAEIGDPNAVIYFPLLCSVGLFVCGLMYLLQELKKEGNDNVSESLSLLLKKKTLITLMVIVGLCIGYTLIFEFLGFIISTLLLLGIMLFFLNGKRKWKLNLIITISTTSLFFIVFRVLLDVNLP